MTTHSSILAWKIPWMEGPDRLHSLGLQRVRDNSARTHTQTLLEFDLKSKMTHFNQVYLLESPG